MENLIANMGQGVEIIGKSLKKKVYSKNPLFYNSRLKIMSNSCREMWKYCVSQAGDDNEKLREYNSATKLFMYFLNYREYS